ncbi:hypothetical protein V8G54_017203 [Vigna mungo]|uniref:Uncharacterized protein n=1 Tax=Vigna mungo TaxID=3915 RepID=A0AAQ3NPB7_VIGMU
MPSLIVLRRSTSLSLLSESKISHPLHARHRSLHRRTDTAAAAGGPSYNCSAYRLSLARLHRRTNDECRESAATVVLIAVVFPFAESIQRTRLRRTPRLPRRRSQAGRRAITVPSTVALHDHGAEVASVVVIVIVVIVVQRRSATKVLGEALEKRRERGVFVVVVVFAAVVFVHHGRVRIVMRLRAAGFPPAVSLYAVVVIAFIVVNHEG